MGYALSLNHFTQHTHWDLQNYTLITLHNILNGTYKTRLWPRVYRFVFQELSSTHLLRGSYVCNSGNFGSDVFCSVLLVNIWCHLVIFLTSGVKEVQHFNICTVLLWVVKHTHLLPFSFIDHNDPVLAICCTVGFRFTVLHVIFFPYAWLMNGGSVYTWPWLVQYGDQLFNQFMVVLFAWYISEFRVACKDNAIQATYKVCRIIGLMLRSEWC